MNIVLVKSDPRAREKPCLRCGYSLRKIVDSTHCPECGLSIWLSLNSNDALDWSHPEWLRRMSAAAWIMAVAQLIGLAAVVLLWREHPAAVQFPMAGSQIALPMVIPPPPPHFRFTGLCAGGYLLMYNAALLLLAVDEGRYPDKWRSYRWAGRITAGAGILIGSYLVLSASNEFLFRVSLLASAVATFAYLRKLAARIPNSLLVRICSIVLFVPVLSLLKTVPILWYFAAIQFLGILEYLPWIYLPASVVLFGWFAVLFRRSAISAAEGWLKETGVRHGDA